MVRTSAERPLLPPLRVLDLTTELGAFAGKVLGDLGADVVKIEPPGGDPDRMLGPFWNDEPNPNRSLRWWSANTSKRSAVVDIGQPEGRETFLRLVRSADFVLESFPPGQMASHGLGWDDLARANPRLILVSMTPYGQVGPRANEPVSDLVLMSMGGMTYLCGDEGHPPVTVAVPQSYYHVGAEGAEAALIAYFARKRTGQGQWVDVNGQACIAWTLLSEIPMADATFHNAPSRRSGPVRERGVLRSRTVFPCADGYVNFLVAGGSAFAGTIRHLIAWMDSEGEAPDFLKEIDWMTWSIEAFAFLHPPEEHPAIQQQVERVEGAFAAFFARRTKEELLAGAAQWQVMLGPLLTIDDLLVNRQLQSSGYWVPVEHEDIGVTVRYPGVLARSNVGGGMIRRRPPNIGEHTFEVLEEYGLGRDEIEHLAAAGVTSIPVGAQGHRESGR
ncbi:MAG TPA: CoA transferase [Dehalococcoidia bacterium]|nr:CoA transferase [Dehalococcoidia bacterium]